MVERMMEEWRIQLSTSQEQLRHLSQQVGKVGGRDGGKCKLMNGQAMMVGWMVWMALWFMGSCSQWQMTEEAQRATWQFRCLVLLFTFSLFSFCLMPAQNGLLDGRCTDWRRQACTIICSLISTRRWHIQQQWQCSRGEVWDWKGEQTHFTVRRKKDVVELLIW